MALIQDYNKLYEQISDIKRIYVNGNIVWPVVSPVTPDYSIPFYIFNNTNNSLVFDWRPSGMNTQYPTVNIWYSFDNSTYNQISVQGTSHFTVTVPSNTRCYLKANMAFEKTYSGNFQWASEIGGNIASLLYGDTFTGNELYYPTYYDEDEEEYKNYMRSCAYMFSGSAITDASNLVLLIDNPSLTGSIECHAYMFRNCSYLTEVPVLPTTLSYSCYSNMFYGCTSLTKAPLLPTVNITPHCYDSMFQGCSSLVSVQSALPALTPEYACYSSMFQGCSSLEEAPEIMLTSVWRQGGGYIYNSCSQMFSGCTSLSKIRVHFTDWPPTTGEYYNTSDWVYNVSSDGIFYKPSGLPAERGNDRIPSGWTVVEV